VNRRTLAEMMNLSEATPLTFLSPLPGQTTAKPRAKVQRKFEEVRDALSKAQVAVEKLTGFLVPNELSEEDIQRALDALKDLDDAGSSLTSAGAALTKAVEGCKP